MILEPDPDDDYYGDEQDNKEEDKEDQIIIYLQDVVDSTKTIRTVIEAKRTEIRLSFGEGNDIIIVYKDGRPTVLLGD